ncbi:MAG: type II secretion system protein N [Pseudomonadota bacterium]
MTRFWLPMGRRVLVLIALLVMLLLLFPLRLAVAALDLGAQGVTARDVSGSVWSGSVTGLAIGGVALGDVDAALSPLHLLIGQGRIAVARPDDAGAASPLNGAVVISRNSFAIDDVTATIPASAALAPLPLGAVTLTGLSVRFLDGACISASGRVGATVAGSFAGVALSQGLSGDATCDGQYVRIALAGQTAQERLELRIDVRGNYIADLIAVEPAADRVAALAAAGFSAVPGGYRLRITGRFQ